MTTEIGNRRPRNRVVAKYRAEPPKEMYRQSIGDEMLITLRQSILL